MLQKASTIEKAKAYIADPAGMLSRKLQKIKGKAKARGIYLLDNLSGKASRKVIPITWGPRTRMELINNVIEALGYTNYLEIGCDKNRCFDEIRVANKTGVDPKSGGTHRMTSDAFFAQNTQTFDCVFIDGLHTYEQTLQDIKNALKCLSSNGTILMHDCLPLSYWAQATDAPVIEYWNGDTWKAAVEARTWSDVDMAVCLIDHGVGIIRKRPNAKPLALGAQDFKQLKFDDLADHYETWLNTIEFDKAMGFVRGS